LATDERRIQAALSVKVAERSLSVSNILIIKRRMGRVRQHHVKIREAVHNPAQGQVCGGNRGIEWIAKQIRQKVFLQPIRHAYDVNWMKENR